MTEEDDATSPKGPVVNVTSPEHFVKGLKYTIVYRMTVKKFEYRDTFEDCFVSCKLGKGRQLYTHWNYKPALEWRAIVSATLKD